MSDITSLLRSAQAGDTHAADQVVALLYADLRRLASSRLRRTGDLSLLDTTALVHESYLRMRGADAANFPDRLHYLSYASQVMRSVVVDLVRARQRECRGGELLHVTLNTAAPELAGRHDAEVLRVHEALGELAAAEPRLARVVELRYFAGLDEADIAACLGVTERTVQRDWRKARMFLAVALRE